MLIMHVNWPKRHANDLFEWCRPGRRGIACLALLGGTLGLGGCSNLLHGDPTRYVNVTEAVGEIAFTKADVKALVETTDKATRNAIMNRALAVIDLNFHEFSRQFNANRQDGSAVAEGSVMGLNIAGTLTRGLTAKTNLAAAGALISGGAGIIDKDYFYAKTVPALVLMMETGRIAALGNIQKNRQAEVADYSGAMALADLEEYYSAGTVTTAISLVVAKAGEAKQEALFTHAIGPKTAAEKQQGKSIADTISSINDANMAMGNAALASLGLPTQNTAAEVRMALSMALRPTTPANIQRVENALRSAGLLTLK